MATDKEFGVKVVVSAVDNVSARFREINKNIAKSPLSKLNNSFRRLGDEIGLRELGKSISGIGSATSNVVSEVGSLATRLAALGGLGGGGLFALGLGFAQFSDEVKDASELLGITTDEYQKLSGAARLAGVEQQTLLSSLGRFSKGIGEAAAGTGEAKTILDAFGISIKDKVTGRVRGFSELLPEVVARLNKIQNANVRNAAGAKLFGKQFADLVPLISDYTALRERASRFVVSEEEIARGDASLKQWDELKTTFMSVSKVAGSQLLSGLSEVLTSLQTILMENKDAIKEFFAAVGKELPAAFAALASAIKTVVGAFTVYNEATGKMELNTFRLKVVLAGIAAVMAGPLIISVINLGGAFWTLGTNLVLVGTRLLQFMSFGQGLLGLAVRIGPALAWLGTAFSSLGTAASVAWAAITGPVGLVVAGVAAVVGLGVLLYKKWEPFRNLIDSIWEKIKMVGASVGQFFGMLGGAAPGMGGFAPAPTLSQAPAASSSIARPIVPAAPVGASLAGGGVLAQGAQVRSSRQEASVKVEFANLPRGTSVKSEVDKGLDFDLTRGFAMGGP